MTQQAVPPPVPTPALYTGRPTWILHAGEYAGIYEKQGNEDHPQIVKWLAACGLPHEHDETAWCSAFANAMMSEAGFRTLNKANARSWLKWGAPLSKWRFGCAAVLWRDDPAGPFGHVGFPLQEDPTDLLMFGGNQMNHVCIAPYPKLRLLGYRWPLQSDLLQTP